MLQKKEGYKIFHTLKKINPVTIGVMLFLSVLFSSCSVVTGIFKAGMGFGIFIVVAIIVVIVVILMKWGKKKS